jgi:hypothetical protein
MSPDEARATRSRLATEAGSGLESVPGKAVIDGSTLLVQLDASPSREAADLVINMLAPPSDTYVSLLASFLDTVATLGRRASAREVVGAR